MSNVGDHVADDGSLARSTGGAAARGAMLIALALVIGLVLMAFALDDPQSEITSGDSGTQTDDATDDTDDASPDDGDSGQDAPDDGVTDSTGTTAAPSTIPPVDEGAADEPHDAAEVNVLVANGTGGKGVAGAVADKLKTRGYIAEAANAPSTAAAIIYYRQGYAGDAREVATILGAPPDILTPAPGDGTIAVAAEAVSDGRLSAANIVVIVGADNAVPPG